MSIGKKVKALLESNDRILAKIDTTFDDILEDLRKDGVEDVTRTYGSSNLEATIGDWIIKIPEREVLDALRDISTKEIREVVLENALRRELENIIINKLKL